MFFTDIPKAVPGRLSYILAFILFMACQQFDCDFRMLLKIRPAGSYSQTLESCPADIRTLIIEPVPNDGKRLFISDTCTIIVKSHSQYFLHLPAIMPADRIPQKFQRIRLSIRCISCKKNAGFLNLKIIRLVKYRKNSITLNLN